jgi:PAS domain S-box-containing protein
MKHDPVQKPSAVHRSWLGYWHNPFLDGGTAVQGPARFLVAVIVILFAAWLRYILGEVAGLNLPYITFYPAVMLVAIAAGSHAGLLATLLSALIANFYFVDPIGRSPLSAAELAGLAIFTITCAVTSLLIGMIQRLFRETAEVRGRLEQRTAALQESEERLRLTIDGARDQAIFMLDAEGRIATWNAGAERVEGFTAQEAIGQPYAMLFVPEDVQAGLPEAQLAAARAHGTSEVEGRRIRRDGSQFAAQVSLSALFDDKGALRGYSKVTRDLSERKKAEAALREGEERFRVTFDTAAVGMTHAAPDGRWLRINDAFLNIVGYLREELLEGMTFADITHPDDVEADLNLVRDVLSGARQSYVLEKRYIHKSGNTVDVSIAVSMVRRADGTPDYLISAVQDITQRKCAEAALRQNEEQLRHVLNSIDVFVGVLTPDGVMIECNSAPLQAAGLKREDVIGVHFADSYWWAYSEQSSAQIRADIEKAAKGELVRYDTLAQIKSPEGNPRFIDIDFALTPMLDAGGRVTHLIPVGIDVSARKRAEQALRDGERQYRATFDNAATGIAHFALDGSFLRVNDRLCEKLGYSRDELLTKTWMELSHPDEIPRSMELHQAALRGETSSYSLEKRYIRKDGSIIWVDFTASLLRSDEGQPLYFVAFIQNITERKRAEQASAHLAAIVTSSSDAILGKTLEGIITSWNAAAERMFGYTADEMIGQSIRRIIPPNLQEEEDQILERLRGGERIEHFETVRLTKDGRVLDVSLSISPVKDAAGNVIGAAKIAHDITERKRAEEQLRYQLQLVRNITDTAAVSIFVNDSDGNISFINPEAERVFGYSLDELKGKSLHEILHHKYPDGRPFPIAECPLGFVYEDGQSVRDYEGVFWRKDGSPVNVVCSNMPIHENRKTVGDVITVQDITERKRHEEHQKMLMNELNHRVKNTLATVQSMAMQTLRNSPNLAEARERFEARLIALSKAHDVLTREKWEGAPLTDIVERAVAPYRGDDPGRFKIEGPALRVSPRAALALAMALHELCTNAVKYGALSNDKGKVTIAWSLMGGKAAPKLKLRWSEKGGPKVTPPTRRGFGSRLIERGLASDLGGEVTMNFAKTGVTCTITAPLDQSGRFLRPA